jgi:hypothetical protein
MQMPDSIQTWSDGYLAIRQRATELRGLQEAGEGDNVTSWPRTTNGDVIDIAAVLAPSLKARPIEFANEGAGRIWRELVHNIETIALLEDPVREYQRDREFWDVIEDLCTYLDEFPVPELWSSLGEQLGKRGARNAGPKEDGPFAHFDAKTYDDLWRAQRDYLSQKHGFDQPPPPPEMGMPGLKIPRSTNSEILQLATYWTNELAKAKQVMGYKAAVDKWHGALADVEKYAKTAKPDDVYPKNNEFWHISNDVSIQIAIGDEAPSKFDLFVESVKDGVTHLPETLEHAASKGIDLVASAGHAVGRIANEAGKGLFAGFGTPMLIGAGLIGLYFITRSREKAEG